MFGLMKTIMELTKDEIREMVYFESVYGKGPIKDLCNDIIKDAEFPWSCDPAGQILYLRDQATLNPHIEDAVDEFEARLLFPEEDTEEFGDDIHISQPNVPVKVTILIERG
jgi:hypothetical protein